MTPPTKHVKGLFHCFSSAGIIQHYAYTQRFPGLSKAFLKGLPFTQDFAKVNHTFLLSSNSGNDPTFQGKALTLVKEVFFGNSRCVSAGMRKKGLSRALKPILLAYLAQLVAGCKNSMQIIQSLYYRILGSVMFATLVFQLFHIGSCGLAVQHLNTNTNMKTKIFLCNQRCSLSHFLFICQL